MGVANAVSINTDLKSEKDFYQTPEVCVQALISSFPFFFNPKKPLFYLDPCCGHQAIGNVFRQNELQIKEFDLFPRQKSGIEKKDFLEESNSKLFSPFDVIVANPPYSKKNEFINLALKLVDYVFMILPMQVVNYNQFHRNYLDRIEYKGRVLMTPKFFMTKDYQINLEKKGGVSAYAWFYWSNINFKENQSNYYISSFEIYYDLVKNSIEKEERG